MAKNKKIYPESGVELSPFVSANYDLILNTASLGMYHKFIKEAIKDIGIREGESILDLGCGTGKNACLIRKYTGEEGKVTGIDISEKMEKQFLKKCSKFDNVFFKKTRADIPIETDQKYDKIFMSFVIHGFPHDVRLRIIENAKRLLKKDGEFVILDFAEFDMDKMPFHHRFVFKTVECDYAFDFIEKDWKNIFEDYGFHNISEKLYLKNYIRLFKAKK